MRCGEFLRSVGYFILETHSKQIEPEIVRYVFLFLQNKNIWNAYSVNLCASKRKFSERNSYHCGLVFCLTTKSENSEVVIVVWLSSGVKEPSLSRPPLCGPACWLFSIAGVTAGPLTRSSPWAGDLSPGPLEGFAWWLVCRISCVFLSKPRKWNVMSCLVKWSHIDIE